jgi:hypothetical protein
LAVLLAQLNWPAWCDQGALVESQGLVWHAFPECPAARARYGFAIEEIFPLLEGMNPKLVVILAGLLLIPSARSFLTIVIARCAKRAVAIQMDCFVATLLAMTAKS